MRSEFVAVRGEMQVGFTGLRDELRREIREGDEETRRLLREGDEETRRYMRVLHEDVIGRIAALGEGRNGPSVPRRSRRKR
ncbi:MAG: hypothetical protein HY657_05420 [Acidobacteria bacterium]|nr:hypothetical protein [Acidobacteriota bacterium]